MTAGGVSLSGRHLSGAAMRRLLARSPRAFAAARRGRQAARVGYARALALLLRTMPVAWAGRRVLDELRAGRGGMSAWSIELATRVDLALRAVPDPDGGNRWLHHRWLAIFEDVLTHAGPLLNPRQGFDHLWLGAGTRNPLTFPFLVFLGGARRTWVVEPEPIPAGDEWRWSWGLQQIVLRVLAGEITSPHFVRDRDDLRGFVDPRQLLFGRDVRAALDRDGVRLVHGVFERGVVPAGTIGLLTSRSVLEHVRAIEACFDAMAAVVAPDGVMYHSIDLSAHAEGDPFRFYYDAAAFGSTAATEGLNGLRLCDYLRAFTERGFETRVVDRTILTDYRLDRARLLDRFRGYTEEDLRCSRAILVAKKRP